MTRPNLAFLEHLREESYKENPAHAIYVYERELRAAAQWLIERARQADHAESLALTGYEQACRDQCGIQEVSCCCRITQPYLAILRALHSKGFEGGDK